MPSLVVVLFGFTLLQKPMLRQWVTREICTQSAGNQASGRRYSYRKNRWGPRTSTLLWKGIWWFDSGLSSVSTAREALPFGARRQHL